MKTATYTPKVSVVIAVFNEADKIRNCLKSLSNQSYKNTEIILIDDCSSDETIAVTKQICAELGLKINIIKLSQHKERGVARNKGAKEATGDYILFIDADMKLSKKVVAECVQLVKSNLDIKAVIVPEESFGEGFWAQCRRLEKQCYVGDDRIEAARFFCKDSFWKVGGWNNKMISGEDWDLTRRMKSKYKTARIKPLIYHHEYKLTLWKAMKKKFYYASVSGIYLEKNPLNILTLIFFIFRPAYLRNWRLIIADPLHGAGMFFLKGVELIAGLFGYLYSIYPLKRK